MSILMVLFFAIFIVSLFSILAFLTSIGDAGRLKKFATRTGLTLIPGTIQSRTEVKGIYKGFPLNVYIKRNSGASDQVYIILTLFEKDASDFNINQRENSSFYTGESRLQSNFNLERTKKILAKELSLKRLNPPWNGGNIYLEGNKLQFSMVYAMAQDYSDTTQELIAVSDILVNLARDISEKQILCRDKEITDSTMNNTFEEDFKICLFCNKKIPPPYTKFCIHCGKGT